MMLPSAPNGAFLGTLYGIFGASRWSVLRATPRGHQKYSHNHGHEKLGITSQEEVIADLVVGKDSRDAVPGPCIEVAVAWM